MPRATRDISPDSECFSRSTWTPLKDVDKERTRSKRNLGRVSITFRNLGGAGTYTLQKRLFSLGVWQRWMTGVGGSPGTLWNQRFIGRS